MDDIEITQFTIDHYDEVIKVWEDAGLILTLSDQKEEIQRIVDKNPDSSFILVKDKQIIGAVIAAFDGRRGYIHHLAIHPDHQGKKYGKLLMKHVTQYYKAMNVVKIHLFIEKSNAKVGKFYEKLGWYYRDDLILMSKTLRS